MEISRGRLAGKYIFFELLPFLIMGVLVFIFILLMFQALRLTEFVLIHGVPLSSIGRIMGYQAISFLPVILPMSLLFSVLSTYGRLSTDSEIIAMKSLGLTIWQIALPALLLSGLAGLLSAQTAFFIAPWGNRQFELLINEISQVKVGATIKEGVFSEGFFDLVIYANKVDEKAGKLEQVFIYDERTPATPLTIIARSGEIRQDASRAGRSALLRLVDGHIHRTQQQTYTKIDFQIFDINLFDQSQFQEKQKSLPSLSLEELRERMNDKKLDDKARRKTEVEYHRRIALSLGCLIFGIIGVGLGTSTNRRSGKSTSLVLCLAVLISYWVAFIGADGIAQKGYLPAWLAVWTVNLIFGAFGFWSLWRHRR